MTTTLHLPAPAEVGLTATVGAQRFSCVAVEPYVTRAGREIRLAVWEASCPDCGATFSIRAPAGSPARLDRRRCAGCRKPGRRIQPGQAA